jgi:23S rRNA (uracil1939-C5)-methyltransferase
MVHGGRALGRLDNGQIALVQGGIPGEVVLARLEYRSGVWQGEVADVESSSEDRIETPLHPGLNYGFITYSRQLSLKREVLVDAFRRACGGELEVPPVTPSPKVFEYRHVVQPAVSLGGLGYRRPGRSKIVRLSEDPTAITSVRRAWTAIAESDIPTGIVEVSIRGNDNGEALVALVAKKPARAYVSFAHELISAGVEGAVYAPYDARGRFRAGRSRLAGVRTIRQAYGHFEITVTATSFSQPNPAAATAAYRAIKEIAPGGNYALDLFAGGGAIAFQLADRYQTVTALEIDRASVNRGELDASRMGLHNVEFIVGDARSVKFPDRLDLLVVDPPRSGLNKMLREAIIKSDIPTIVYMSCNVATWARDVAHLLRGSYELEFVRPFDFFPHTHHLEVLSQLRRD